MAEKNLEQMQEAVAEIREKMAAAAREAGRDPAAVQLCAACKTRTAQTVAASAALPIDVFGENHVQELCANFDAGAYCGKPSHFIGHLQTNKIKKVLGRASLIQSVDSEHLLNAIEKEAAKAGIVQNVLLEVNIGGEESKTGVAPEALWPLLDAAAAQEHIRVKGLMAIPAVFGAGILEAVSAVKDVAAGNAGMFPGWGATIAATIVAFVVGYVVIIGFLKFVSTFSYKAFAIYRIALAVVVALLLICGVLHPTEVVAAA